MVYWLINRLDVGAHALSSGIEKRKVLNKSSFLKGKVFSDCRSDFKTKKAAEMILRPDHQMQ